MPDWRVTVLSLGGTIAMMPTEDGPAVPRLSASDLAAAVPGLAEAATVVADSFRQLPGAHLTFQDLVALADRIDEELGAGADGVVVTQGTDTIEETAFLLDLLLDVDAPVVVTGAMRNPSLAGGDGAANVLAAVQVAAAPESSGLGVLVVMNDEIHAARFVTKSHTTLPSSFRSTPGPLGWVVEGAPRIVMSLRRGITVGRESSRRVRVGLYTASFDDDGVALAAMTAGGDLDGLVVQALGGGHVPSALLGPLDAAVARMPVVLASRTGSGEILRSTYGFAGSETDLVDRGLIPAGWLTGPKARVLLICSLRDQLAGEDVRARFSAVNAA